MGICIAFDPGRLMSLRYSIGRGLQLIGIIVTGLSALMFFSPKVGMWPLLYISVAGVIFFGLGLWISGRTTR